MQTFWPDGITATLDTGSGGGRGLYLAKPIFCDIGYGDGLEMKSKSRTVLARHCKGPTNRKSEYSGVAIPIMSSEQKHSDGHEPIYVCLPNGETVYAKWYEKCQCYITIRRLTPRECFRLQGFEDEYFNRAQMVNSDSQLYKQAGNSVTVNVVEAIGRKIPK